ncbi:VirB4 family type IV secretion/conjugal transfer ATPase [Aliarcobacter skirrowii]|uniref:CagE TrbE VirB component of type IV transporter system central domain-containing protein n=1 Tax=Aliarcobacter skirrowii TaxID=28200 RepID=A0AAW9DAR3_9BACT|nr:hypothetical protein [Aliarcobacter skirrowii]MDX4069258.1 hypothetical protein [Aliarcobacter skirrowii]
MFHKTIKTIIDLSYKSLQKENLFSSVNPLVKFHEEYSDTLVTLNNNFVKVIGLRGLEYSGLDGSKLRQHFDFRRVFFNSLDEKIIFSNFSIREKKANVLLNTSKEDYSEIISNKWARNFTENFKSYHYIVISTTSNTRFSDLSVFENLIEGSTKEKLNTIKLASDKVLRELKEFEPNILEGDELLSFFASYINGRKTVIKKPKNNYIRDILCNCEISFPQNCDYMIFNNNQKIYAKYISIMLFKNEKFDSSLVEELMSAKIEFSIFQSFKRIDKTTSIELVTDKMKNAKTFFSSSDMAIEQLKQLAEEIENSITNIFDYSFTIQVRNTDIEELTKDVAELQAIISRYGFQLVTETTNIEPLFFSALPGLENYNTRKRNLKTEDIATLNTFSTVSQGFSKCSWGDMPVTQFLNSHNTVFDFTFHKGTKYTDLGHTLLIGGSNSGKTTLMTFLIQESQKFKKLKTLILDSLQGMKVFTNFIGGNYINFEGESEKVNLALNPLMLDDSIKNREFLKNFLKLMLKVEDSNPNDIQAIDNLIANNFSNLKKEDRNFRNVWSTLGAAKDENIIEKRMSNWITGSNGKYFSNYDSLEFKNRLNSFNMDSILNNQEVLGLVALYMFYRFMNAVETTSSSGLLFIDEIRNYLENKDMAQQIAKAIFEYRKKDIVIVMAAQDHRFFQTNEYAKQILGGSLANLILFPDSTVDNDYKETLNLTSEEFRFIKNPTNKREVLFKRVGGGSVVLNVDLHPLDDYLKVFNSSTSAVQIMEKLQNENPKNWREEYLKC